MTYAGQTRGGYGVHIVLDHGGGVTTLYGHCSALAVVEGQVVEQGQIIAYVGSTGDSTANHCHFEVSVNGAPVDPAVWFSGETRAAYGLTTGEGASEAQGQ